MAARSYPLLFLRRLIAPLLLLVISVHAVTPLGEPMRRVVGSAFSAETTAVSLRSDQRSVVVKQAEMPRSPAVMPPIAVIAPPVMEATSAAPRPTGLGPRGPPELARIALDPVSPRAPPAA